MSKSNSKDKSKMIEKSEKKEWRINKFENLYKFVGMKKDNSGVPGWQSHLGI